MGGKSVYQFTELSVHCKKYVVVLTTKWLHELQMSEYVGRS